MISKIQKFFSEVIVELKKVNWPTRSELIEATWVVLVSTFFLGIFIGSTDLIFSRLLTVIIR
jgi:preprotein translocase subunit SecE